MIAEYMLSVMEDERAKTADRIEAGKWLANRGFGTAPLVFDAGVSPEHLLHDFLSKLSIEDLETMRAILPQVPTVRSPGRAVCRESGWANGRALTPRLVSGRRS